MIKRNIDVIAYVALVAIMLFYAVYVKATCEELGCLAIIFPILGIMGLSVIEFFINIALLAKKRRFSPLRKIVFVVSGIIGVFSLVLLLLSVV